MFARPKPVWAVVLVAFLSLAGVAAAAAQTTPGNAPPAANQTGLVTINPGQEHWYTFHSASADPNAGNKQITALLAHNSMIQGSVTFDVWTPAGLQRAAEGKTDINARPVGAGTLHPIKDGDRYGGQLEWTGGSGRPQTYVIQVKSKAWGPVQYSLTVNGNYVQFPDGTLPEQASKQGAAAAGGSRPPQATQPTAQPTAAAAGTGGKTAASQPVAAGQSAATAGPAASEPAGGSGPHNALPLDGATRSLKPGQSQWYVLNFPGESKTGDVPSGTLLITAEPWGSANFNVWSSDRLRALALGDTRAGVPVGISMLHPITRDDVTVGDRYDGKPAWTNRSKYPATFYIEVHTTGDKPSTYTLGYDQTFR